MKNFLNQEIGEGSVVYRGERQGSHGRLVGVVDIDHGDGNATVAWNFELFERWQRVTRRHIVSIRSLVVLDEDVLKSISEENNA